MVSLGIDDHDLAACVGCGLCLPHCPTYRVTHEEGQSPRGRIAAMRLVQWDGGAIDDDVVASIDSCVQCRGCETACPSGVPYGRMMEATRSALADAGRITRWWERIGLAGLGHHRALLAASSALALAQRTGLVPARVASALPAQLAVRREPLRGADPRLADAWLHPGCVMDAWQRPVHLAAMRVMRDAGARVAVPDARPCCGALHEHAGLRAQASALAERTMASMPGDAPIVVDSAGCGAAMLGYGELLGTEAAHRFSARVVDIHTWLAERIDRLPEARRPVPGAVAVHDPCHLRHVQRAHLPVRSVLRPYVEALVELDDEGLCCGAGGAWSTLHPTEAAQIRDRKLAAITRSGAGTVASANPGCTLHLAAAGIRVVHPVELIDEAIRGTR